MLVYILLLILNVNPVQVLAEGSAGLNLFFDHATFKESEQAMRLELYFQVPYSDLVFELRDSSFVGRYLITAQVMGQGNEPIAGEVWEKEVTVINYDQSKQTDRYDLFQFNLLVPKPKQENLNGSVLIEDMNSTRQSRFIFKFDVPGKLSDLRLSKFGDLNPNRSYAGTDTVEVYWEFYSPAEEKESCAIEIIKRNKVLAEYVRAPNSTRCLKQIAINEYKAWLPLSNFSELESGNYELRVRSLSEPKPAKRKTEITIINPFYLSTKEFLEKVDELIYIATEEEMHRLSKAPASERLRRWQEFWQSKDPTPTTEANEVMEEYFKRIEYCKKQFGKGDRGYKSDRARIYVKYGPPDNIESNPFERSTQAYEIWYYYNSNLRFIFVDVSGFGEYKLSTDLIR
ncbi:MAG: GWxTD domain-containing protein [bacterium]